MALLRLMLPLLLVTICFGSEVSSSEGSCDRQEGVGCNDKSDDDQILLQGKLNLTKLEQSSTNPGNQHLTKMAKPNLPKVVKQALNKMAEQNLPMVAKEPVELSKQAKIAEVQKHTAFHQEDPDFDPAKFSDTMTLSAVVEIGKDSPQEGILVALVGEDEVRGFQETPSKPPFGPYKGKAIWQITMYANKGGEELWFVFVTPDGTPSKLGETLKFVINGNYGNVLKPMVLHAPTPPPPPAGCKNDDATVIENAKKHGITVSGCAEAEPYCKHPAAYEPCPVTCGKCKGPPPTEPPTTTTKAPATTKKPECTSDDATVVENAKKYGITIKGCADVQQKWCGMKEAYEPCGCICGK
eukprot:gnl/TRDRNA2_/TRDRNA2_178308_c0_seq1.p1 gnl/TRDRNA2_/TRDRNA2_178308_c0~~gnl/TRDRNA2_/TRDRNA2_178308_c0_seq1.p1  ORF type:complete len:354 (-),score=59.53 gnl/TRDRNA2_/TRDRNA2_178308_c0_seq1:231-1292(-)